VIPFTKRPAWKALKAEKKSNRCGIYAQARQFHEQSDPALPENESLSMKTLGFDKPLYILPFDHRGSFETKMFGWHGDLNAAQTEIARRYWQFADIFKRANKPNEWRSPL
jgi:hypothetical protein